MSVFGQNKSLTATSTTVLKNKTISATDNTLLNIPSTSLSQTLQNTIANVLTTSSLTIPNIVGLQSNLNLKANLNGDATFNNVVINGNLTTLGNLTYINTTNLEIQDNMAILASNNTTDVVDIGQTGRYVSNGNTLYTGCFRDASDGGRWKFYHGLSVLPTTTVLLSNGYTSSIITCADGVASNDCVNLGQLQNGSMTLSSKTLHRPVVNRVLNSSTIDFGIGSYSGEMFTGSVPLEITNFNVSVSSASALNTPSFKSNTAGTFNSKPLFLTGLSVNPTDGLIANVSIPSDGIIQGVNNLTSAIEITASNSSRTLIRLNYTGFLNKQQTIRLHNRSSTEIYIGNMATNASGYIKSMPFTILYGNSFLDLVYDDFNDRFIVPNQSFSQCLYQSYVFRWDGDRVLSLFLNTHKTYHTRINFCNATSTINGVSGFSNGTNVSGTTYGNCLVEYSGGSPSQVGTVQSSFLTDTESAKFSGIVFNLTSATFTFSNMTQNNYYAFSYVGLVWDTVNTQREFLLEDLTGLTGFKKTIFQQNFSTNSSNSPATIVRYVFRKDNFANSYAIRLTQTVASSLHLYGIFLEDLGNSL